MGKYLKQKKSVAHSSNKYQRKQLTINTLIQRRGFPYGSQNRIAETLKASKLTVLGLFFNTQDTAHLSDGASGFSFNNFGMAFTSSYLLNCSNCLMFTSGSCISIFQSIEAAN
jgi:hypothetical protein